MSTTVKFKLETNVELFKILVDHDEIGFNADGIGIVQFIPDHEYSLFWYFYGEKGTKYDLSIVEPSNIKFHIVRTIDSSKKDNGVFWIKI